MRGRSFDCETKAFFKGCSSTNVPIHTEMLCSDFAPAFDCPFSLFVFQSVCWLSPKMAQSLSPLCLTCGRKLQRNLM